MRLPVLVLTILLTLLGPTACRIDRPSPPVAPDPTSTSPSGTRSSPRPSPSATRSSAGCGAEDLDLTSPTPGPVSVELRRGETRRLCVGGVNPSIGGGWDLVRRPEPAVATATLTRQQRSSNDAAPGGTWYDVFIEVAGVSEGASTFSYQYCFRTATVPCDPASDSNHRQPVTVEVRVR